MLSNAALKTKPKGNNSILFRQKASIGNHAPHCRKWFRPSKIAPKPSWTVMRLFLYSSFCSFLSLRFNTMNTWNVLRCLKLAFFLLHVKSSDSIQLGPRAANYVSQLVNEFRANPTGSQFYKWFALHAEERTWSIFLPQNIHLVSNRSLRIENKLSPSRKPIDTWILYGWSW